MIEHALFYQSLGFNLVPLGADKRPVCTGGVSRSGQPYRFNWRDWIEKSQPKLYWEKVSNSSWWADVQGIAAICGPVSGDLACLDFDKAPYEAVTVLLKALHIQPHWVVATPGGGFHVWVRVPHLMLPKGKLDRPGVQAAHVELRFTGHYVALPPSAHPTGSTYAFVGSPPTTLPPAVSANALLAAYDAVTKQPEPKRQTANGTVPHAAPGEVTEAYVKQALESELRILAGAHEGSRNDQLNRAAYNLGQLVADGVLDEHDVIRELEQTALGIGLEEGEIAQTILSGLNDGKSTPRGLRLKTTLPVQVEELCFDGEGDLEPVWEGGSGHKQWPYGVVDGRIVLFTERKNGDVDSAPVADFTAAITQEITTEHGDKVFVVTGEGKRAGPFRLEVPAETFGEDRRLRALLEGAVGALDGTYAGMNPHLGPAIKKLTDEEALTHLRRFHRVGWTGNRYLLPGREPDGIQIELPDRRLPYGMSTGADLAQGLAALDAALQSVEPEKTTVLLAHVLTAPMARLAGWLNERYAVFVKGLTGTFKTSVAQTLMGIYGRDFARDDRLLKWGDGATRNAIMQMAAACHDAPFFVDNYKPNTGGGSTDFINLIHAIMEGGEKARLNRASQLMDSKPIFCWPFFTGEDVPDSDPAALARILVVTFDRKPDRNNRKLTEAQAGAEHLSAVGSAWLTWLEANEGQTLVARLGKVLPDKRAQWADFLYTQRADVANPLRVATNLALNELAFLIACEHPTISPVLIPYHTQHQAGLEEVAATMAESTAQGLEALRFLSILRELLATGRALLLEKHLGAPYSDQDKDRHIGWKETDGSAYLLMGMAIAMVERFAKEKFYSTRQLYAQLEDLGFLASSAKGRQTKAIKIGGDVYRVAHVKSEALEDKEDSGNR